MSSGILTVGNAGGRSQHRQHLVQRDGERFLLGQWRGSRGRGLSDRRDGQHWRYREALAIGRGGYGYYNISGGSIANTSGGAWFGVGGGYANTATGISGVLDMSGGTLAPSWLFLIAQNNNGYGVVNVSGGLLNSGTDATHGMDLGWSNRVWLVCRAEHQRLRASSMRQRATIRRPWTCSTPRPAAPVP